MTSRHETGRLVNKVYLEVLSRKQENAHLQNGAYKIKDTCIDMDCGVSHEKQWNRLKKNKQEGCVKLPSVCFFTALRVRLPLGTCG